MCFGLRTRHYRSRQMQHRLLILGVFLFGSVSHAFTQEPPRIAELIGKLGSPKFAERQAATKELNEIGAAALPALRKAAADGGEAETQNRARQLVAAIEARVYGPLAELRGHAAM